MSTVSFVCAASTAAWIVVNGSELVPVPGGFGLGPTYHVVGTIEVATSASGRPNGKNWNIVELLAVFVRRHDARRARTTVPTLPLHRAVLRDIAQESSWDPQRALARPARHQVKPCAFVTSDVAGGEGPHAASRG